MIQSFHINTGSFKNNKKKLICRFQCFCKVFDSLIKQQNNTPSCFHNAANTWRVSRF